MTQPTLKNTITYIELTIDPEVCRRDGVKVIDKGFLIWDGEVTQHVVTGFIPWGNAENLRINALTDGFSIYCAKTNSGLRLVYTGDKFHVSPLTETDFTINVGILLRLETPPKVDVILPKAFFVEKFHVDKYLTLDELEIREGIWWCRFDGGLYYSTGLEAHPSRERVVQGHVLDERGEPKWDVQVGGDIDMAVRQTDGSYHAVGLSGFITKGMAFALKAFDVRIDKKDFISAVLMAKLPKDGLINRLPIYMLNIKNFGQQLYNGNAIHVFHNNGVGVSLIGTVSKRVPAKVSRRYLNRVESIGGLTLRIIEVLDQKDFLNSTVFVEDGHYMLNYLKPTLVKE